jgi:hypothetical protein
VGECGEIPPSVFADISILCFAQRFYSMSDDCIVKKVFNELTLLNDQGFHTWVTSLKNIERDHGICTSSMSVSAFKHFCKNHLINNFIYKWSSELRNVDLNPLLRTYSLYKRNFELEPYLSSIKNHQHRIAYTKLRASSHTLEIEKGRYRKPKVDIKNRLCPLCNIVEDEFHFVMECKLYENERKYLLSYLSQNISNFDNMTKHQKFVSIMSTKNTYCHPIIGKFIHSSFNVRSNYILT